MLGNLGFGREALLFNNFPHHLSQGNGAVLHEATSSLILLDWI